MWITTTIIQLEDLNNYFDNNTMYMFSIMNKNIITTMKIIFNLAKLFVQEDNSILILEL